MSNNKAKTAPCQICGKIKGIHSMMPAIMVRDSLVEAIRQDHPGWSSDGYICKDDLNQYRSRQIEQMIEKEKGELSSQEADVVRSIRENDILAKNVNFEFDANLSLGQRLADRIADFGGSWTFIITFMAFCLAWMGINTFALFWRPFDEYPFILLNLVLSCMAAVQAPVIMMSQNRQEAKDRLRSEHDYMVNLKAELGIRHLNEKVDHLVMHQWERLLEIQQIQMEIMQSLTESRK